MRAVVQRVHEARVRVDGACVAEMGPGLLVLVGVGRGDGPDDATMLARKLCGLRIFEDAAGRMNRDLLETGGSLGLISQFTLHGDARKGRRPSFGEAAEPERAQPLFEALCTAARDRGVPVVTGRFGAAMRVELVGDGPVTILLDTERRF